MLLEFEGGWVDDPVDPGGATNKGITFQTFKAYGPRLLGIPATLENLKKLTDTQAGTIYELKFWDKIDCNHIANQDLANILADFYVNAGSNAIKILQRILNNNFSAGISVDGGMGPATCAAMQAAESKDLPTYKTNRIRYYRDLVARRPELQKFLKGWLNRVAKFPDM